MLTLHHVSVAESFTNLCETVDVHLVTIITLVEEYGRLKAVMGVVQKNL